MPLRAQSDYVSLCAHLAARVERRPMLEAATPHALRRALTSVALALALGVPAAADAQATTLSARAGVYADDNDTLIGRTLARAGLDFGALDAALDEAIDVISSASIDVRTSPALDVVSSASLRDPHMNDQRFQTTLALGYDDDAGHRASIAPTLALENDYRSAGVSARGACEIFERHTTLSAALTASSDRATSALDASFSGTSQSLGGSLGVGHVLAREQQLRLRYDALFRQGYMASPYRAVRFGDYRTLTLESGAIQFARTIGPTAGYPERLPRTRLRHALDGEWLVAPWTRVALLLGYRFALDDWSLLAHSLRGELRFALGSFLVPLGYRHYRQRGAGFFRGKYTDERSAYSYVSADKELGEVRGHDASVGAAYRWGDAAPGSTRGSIDLSLHLLRYDYPEFALLAQRSALHVDLGFSLEL